MSHSYKQETKCFVRHNVIKKAVELLTTKRSETCCVRNSYVRDMYDYFISLSESHEKTEAQKIDISYIREWEHMHNNSIGYRRPDELSVCYLSGPEPENDFNEFVSMGVLPQNIWAFECERITYLQALKSLDASTYMQPKIIKTSIERFFENSPKTFDIVYIDACASLISDQKALKCVSTLFQQHRLNSPGVLITNFASYDESKRNEIQQYADITSRYLFIKENRSATLINDSGTIRFKDNYEDFKSNIELNLGDAYGKFITSMICNTASITIPTLRFCNSTYLQTISQTNPIPNPKYDFIDVNTIKDNTMYKYLSTNAFLQQKNVDYAGTNRIFRLSLELSGNQSGYDLLSCMRKIHDMKNSNTDFPDSIKQIIKYFETNKNLYQFLDKPNKNLFLDSVINQLAYPMHYVSDKSIRYTYVAKEKRMYTDLIPFDECRYIYDWIPAIHQIPKAFSNPSWQYTFRFGLDGLIKQRINYNNEFFFQGSVVSKSIDEFKSKEIPKRIKVN